MAVVITIISIAFNVVFTWFMRSGQIYYVKWSEPLVLFTYILWICETIIMIGKKIEIQNSYQDLF